MQHQVMGYDRSATMFAPDGHILQVEYAGKAVRLGAASIGIKCSDGVLIVADKGEKDKLIVLESTDKIHEIDEHILGSAAGIMSDARVLINQARLIAQRHRVTYDSPIDTESVIREIADIKQQYTQNPGIRPFGVSLMLAGMNGKNYALYISEITGNYFEYYATAIGANDSKIKDILRQEYKKDMNIEEGIKLAMNIFKEVLGEKFDVLRINAGYIKKGEEKLKKLNKEEIRRYN